MDRTFSVDVIGFNATERIVLGSIFNLSTRRAPKYEAFAGLATSGTRRQPDIILADSADPQHIERAKVLHDGGGAPVVLVGDNDRGTGWPVIPRPLQWARLFRAFDLAVGALNASSGATHPNAALDGFIAHSTGPRMVRTGANRVDPTATITSTVVIPGAPWILVVDDSAPVRAFMREVLAPLAYNIDVAESGEQAIGMTGGRDYACIFLDVMLPGVDGYQVCRLIKSKPTGRRTPVIMLTSKSSPFDRIRGTMAGCDSYLTKPVDEEKLRSVMNKLLTAHGHGSPVTIRS